MAQFYGAITRKRCAVAKTVHGWETREVRKTRAEKFREMKALMRLYLGSVENELP